MPNWSVESIWPSPKSIRNTRWSRNRTWTRIHHRNRTSITHSSDAWGGGLNREYTLLLIFSSVKNFCLYFFFITDQGRTLVSIDFFFGMWCTITKTGLCEHFKGFLVINIDRQKNKTRNNNLFEFQNRNMMSENFLFWMVLPFGLTSVEVVNIYAKWDGIMKSPPMINRPFDHKVQSIEGDCKSTLSENW